METRGFKFDNNLNINNSRVPLYRIILLDSGSAEVEIDFNTYCLSSPSLIFVSENQLLNIKNGAGELEGRVVSFSNDFFCIKLNRSETFCDAVIFNTTRPPYVILPDENVGKIDYLITAMHNELMEANVFQEEIIISQLKTLLLSASKLKLNQFGDVNLSKQSTVVVGFQNLLDQKFQQEHNVQFYADQLHISSKGLNKAVKKELGRNVSDLIKEKIIIEAKREMYTTELSIKEIAFKLGFEDPAYFSRFFKKETSHSPKEYAELL